MKAFAQGSVTLVVHPETLEPRAMVEHLVRQAIVAEESGFDGVAISEHHAGHEHYLPTPLLASSWVLAATERIWAGACPLLLPLRSTTLVIESVAWMEARFPGRVGIGLAPGYSEDDFAVVGCDHAERRRSFWDGLPVVCDGLCNGRTTELLARDPAVAALAAKPVPVVAAVGGPLGMKRSARAGAGVLLATFVTTARSRELFAEYKAAGGEGARVLSRRVWLGTPPEGWLDALRQRYEAAGVDASFLEAGPATELVNDADPEALASKLAAIARDGDTTALSIRVSLPGATPDQVVEQIAAVGNHVLPRLRPLLAEPAGTPGAISS